MYGSRKKTAPSEPASAPPKDALEALMDGATPDKESLLFPNERPGYKERPDYQPTFSGRDNGKGRSEGQRGDRNPANKSRASGSGDLGDGLQPQGAYNSVKNGATKSGVFVKDKTVAGASYLKERDWSREKQVAGKAGAATKTGAIYVGSGVAKGAGWLWSAGKNGVDNIRNKSAPKE